MCLCLSKAATGLVAGDQSAQPNLSQVEDFQPKFRLSWSSAGYTGYHIVLTYYIDGIALYYI